MMKESCFKCIMYTKIKSLVIRYGSKLKRSGWLNGHKYLYFVGNALYVIKVVKEDLVDVR